MFERYRKKLVGKFKDLEKSQNVSFQTLFNYQQISNLFEESYVPFTRWAVSPNLIAHVLNDILLNNRSNVIELGSGASTFYIAKLIKKFDLETRFYSVEADERWIYMMEKQLKIYDLHQTIELIHVPTIGLEDKPIWFDEDLLVQSLPKDFKTDLLLVDAPPGLSGSNARLGALNFFKSYLTENCSIYLDDVNRADEKNILEKWEEALKNKFSLMERYAFLHRNPKFDVRPFRADLVPK